MEVDEAKVEGEAAKPEQEYAFAKYNVKPRVPRRYTDEEYNRHLKSDDWSRQETDYLMDLVEDYDLRWMVIADRYDFQPQPMDAEANATALVPAKRYRTMEQMKARYYFIAASMLALEHPPSEMSEAEFDLHEKMMKFDPDRERARKELAALQLNRTADEVREEGILLEELKRITSNEQNFMTERRELYSRLEVPISVGNTTMYQSSQGLSQLLQTLLQADKSKKRRSILGPEAAAPSPAGQTPTSNAPTSARDSRADTPSHASAGPSSKKGSVAAAAAAAKEPPQTVKTLTPAEEARYGVQHCQSWRSHRVCLCLRSACARNLRGLSTRSTCCLMRAKCPRRLRVRSVFWKQRERKESARRRRSRTRGSRRSSPKRWTILILQLATPLRLLPQQTSVRKRDAKVRIRVRRTAMVYLINAQPVY
jgi:DNA methyltransferase 1-associated protein 1